MAEKIVSTQDEVNAANKLHGNVLVKPKESTTVMWNSNAKHHKEGEKSVIHRLQAERLVKKGICKIVKTKDE